MELDFLDEPETPAAEPVAETPAAEAAAPAAEQATPEPEPQPQEGQPRGPDGKFQAKAADPAPAPAPEPTAQTPAPAPEAQQAPAEDDRYAKLEAQVAGLTKALTATRQQNRQPAPDRYVDPDAYDAWQQTNQLLERADWSRQVATAKYGEELVAKAQEWAAAKWESDPVYQQQALATRDPFGLAVESYQREQALQLLADPKVLEQFRAWQSGNPAGAAPAPVAAPPGQHIPPKVEAPPPSIAAAPNAGGPAATPVGGGNAYEAIF